MDGRGRHGGLFDAVEGEAGAAGDRPAADGDAGLPQVQGLGDRFRHSLMELQIVDEAIGQEVEQDLQQLRARIGHIHRQVNLRFPARLNMTGGYLDFVGVFDQLVRVGQQGQPASVSTVRRPDLRSSETPSWLCNLLRV